MRYKSQHTASRCFAPSSKSTMSNLDQWFLMQLELNDIRALLHPRWRNKSFNTRAEVMSRCAVFRQTVLRNRYCNFTSGKMVSVISPTITRSQLYESTVCHTLQQMRPVVILRQVQDRVVAALGLSKATLLSAISFAIWGRKRGPLVHLCDEVLVCLQRCGKPSVTEGKCHKPRWGRFSNTQR